MQAKGRAKVRDAVRKRMGEREGGEATSEGVTTTRKLSSDGALSQRLYRLINPVCHCP